jgi:hypothetical protein
MLASDLLFRGSNFYPLLSSTVMKNPSETTISTTQGLVPRRPGCAATVATESSLLPR